MAAMIRWTPSEFWRATWHDFESALWSVARQSAPRDRRRDGMVDGASAPAVNAMFDRLSRKQRGEE